MLIFLDSVQIHSAKNTFKIKSGIIVITKRVFGVFFFNSTEIPPSSVNSIGNKWNDACLNLPHQAVCPHKLTEWVEEDW